MALQIELIEPRRLLAAFTGHTFEDANADNIYQPATDRRLPGVTAYVDLNNDGKYQSTEPHATSDSNGLYAISGGGLNVGKAYRLGFVLPSGFTQSAALPLMTLGGGTTAVPDAGAWRYATVKVNGFLDPNDNGKQDAGETAPTDVTYWDDANRNGRQDSDEPTYGPGNPTLKLKPGLHMLWPQYTGGEYELTGGLNSVYLTVVSGQTTTYTVGYFHPAAYTGHVYQDTNRNGKYDPGEGLGNRQVYADINNDGREDGGDVVDQSLQDGSYRLPMPVGTYKIRQTTPKGWADAAALGVTVKSGTSAVSSGHDLESHAVTTATTGVITGAVYSDTNGNGKQDGGEPALTGDPATAYIDVDHDNNFNPDVDQDFQYAGTAAFTISNLKPGTYWVGLYGYGRTTTRSHPVVVKAGKTASAGAYGRQPRFYVNATVYQDNDRDGKFEAPTYDKDDHRLGGDDGASGRVVYIDANDNGRRDSGEPYQTTGDDPFQGTTFDLGPGTYIFREELPPDWYETGRQAYGLSATVTFAADGKVRLPGDGRPYGSESSGTTYGLRFLTAPDLAVRGRVFNDANGNGRQDAGETGTGNGGDVYADLNGNGRFDGDEPTAGVGNDGTFFLDVPPGTTTVRQLLETGWTQTYAGGATVTIGKSTTTVAPVVFGRHATAAAAKYFTVIGWAFIDTNRDRKEDNDEGVDGDLDFRSVYVDTDKSGDLSQNDAYIADVDRGRYVLTLPADGKTYRVLLDNEQGSAFTTPSYYDVSSTTDGQVITRDFGVAP